MAVIIDQTDIDLIKLYLTAKTTWLYKKEVFSDIMKVVGTERADI